MLFTYQCSYMYYVVSKDMQEMKHFKPMELILNFFLSAKLLPNPMPNQKSSYRKKKLKQNSVTKIPHSEMLIHWCRHISININENETDSCENICLTIIISLLLPPDCSKFPSCVIFQWHAPQKIIYQWPCAQSVFPKSKFSSI